jgi:hypothetical protein
MNLLPSTGKGEKGGEAPIERAGLCYWAIVLTTDMLKELSHSNHSFFTDFVTIADSAHCLDLFLWLKLFLL